MADLLMALKWPLIAVQGVISLVLIIMILLQSGKGDDLGSALSGSTGGHVQGTGGTSRFLVRGTVIFAILFMVNSVTLAWVFRQISKTSIGTSAPVPLVPAAGMAPNAIAPNAIQPPAQAPAKTK